PVERWVIELGEGKPRFDRYAKLMAKMPPPWKTPYIDSLVGKAKGQIELRWDYGGVEHRIFGYYCGSMRFAMMVGCTKRGKNKYDPPDAMGLAVRRRKEIERGEATLSEYSLPFDD